MFEVKYTSLSSKLFCYLIKAQDPDVSRTTDEIIVSRGFRCERHEVETNDGYILTIHRIIIPSLSYNEVKPPPILLQHGFGNCSSHWLMGSGDTHFEPNNNNNNNEEAKVSNSLGFTLSNAGYDVWLSNFRGSRYSQKHKSLRVEDEEFWDFCCDEVIEHDLPSIIDHILKVTLKEKIGFVGFSYGSTAMLGLLSSQPKYNQVVKPMIALAPAVSFKRVRGLVKYLMLLGYDYFPFVQRFFTTRLCNSLYTSRLFAGHRFEYFVQRLVMFALKVPSENYFDQIDDTVVGPFLAHAGDFSRKLCLQSCQFRETFAKYDYGKRRNFCVYHQETPPEYNIKNITNESVCIIYAKNDNIATEENVMSIVDKIDVHDVYQVPDGNWGHLDFNVSKDLGLFVNKKVVSLLEAFR